MEQSPLFGNMHLLRDWMQRLLEEAQQEASHSQVKLFGAESRNAVWETCEWFGYKTRGIPGVACRLFERYVYKVMNSEESEDFCSNQRHLPLIVSCCVMLATKMNSTKYPLDAVRVQFVLSSREITYTVKQIIASEFKVFSVVGFQVPLWTCVEIGEFLAVKADVPLVFLYYVEKLIDVAEYRRHRINQKVLTNAFCHAPTIDNKVIPILTLHLAAGAVAALGRLFPQYELALVLPLAQITRASALYIDAISKAISEEFAGNTSNRNSVQ